MKAAKRARLLELIEAAHLSFEDELELESLASKARADLSDLGAARRQERQKLAKQKAKLRASMLARTREINPEVPVTLRQMMAHRHRNLNGTTNSRKG